MKNARGITLWMLGILCVCAIHATDVQADAEADAAPSSSVTITLRPSAVAVAPVMRIGQIAVLTGGDAALRQRIAELDIADARGSRRTATVSQHRVAIRLLLAGIPDDAYEMQGASQVALAADSQRVTDTMLLAALHQSLAEHLGVPAADLDVRLTEPLARSLDFPEASPGDIDIRPFVPQSLRAGPMRLKTGIYVQDKLTEVVHVSLDARVFHTVARAAREIPRGHVLTEQDVQRERRPLSDQELARVATQLLGKRSRRLMKAGEIIKSWDLENPRPEAPPVLVRARDNVRLIARKGGLMVTVPAGEALEAGRLGETIRVRNRQSKKVLAGRVLSRSEVEVTF